METTNTTKKKHKLYFIIPILLLLILIFSVFVMNLPTNSARESYNIPKSLIDDAHDLSTNSTLSRKEAAENLKEKGYSETDIDKGLPHDFSGNAYRCLSLADLVFNGSDFDRRSLLSEHGFTYDDIERALQQVENQKEIDKKYSF